jgi:hypothetical protein
MCHVTVFPFLNYIKTVFVGNFAISEQKQSIGFFFFKLCGSKVGIKMCQVFFELPLIK